MAGILDQATDVRKTLPPVKRREVDPAALAAFFRPYPAGAAPSPPDESLLSPEQLATIQGLRNINAAMRGQSGPAAPADPYGLAAMQAKVNALKSDQASIAANGLPGYFDPQARTGFGLAPGAYQFNMPGPAPAAVTPTDPRAAMLRSLQGAATSANASALADRAESLPASVDPMTNVRGSLPNNMRERFLALAAANMPPSEAELAVSGRRPKLGLSFTEFQAQRDAKRAALDQQIDELANGKTMDSLEPDAEARLAAAERERNQLDATAAGLNTYARREAQAQGISPGELLAQNKRRAQESGGYRGMAGRRGMAAIERATNPAIGGQGDGQIPLQMARMLDMTPAQLAAINDRIAERNAEAKARGDALALEREKLDVTRQGNLAQLEESKAGRLQRQTDAEAERALRGKELDAGAADRERNFGLKSKLTDAQIADMERQGQLDQQDADPLHAVNQAMMLGQMTPEVFDHLKKLHDSANLFLGPERLPRSAGIFPLRPAYETYNRLGAHFAQANPEVPRLMLQKLVDQYFLRHPDYGFVPQQPSWSNPWALFQ